MHPSIKILSLLALAMALHVMNPLQLSIVGSVLLFFMFYHRARVFLSMLKRTRWLLVSIMAIFAFNTPGEYVLNWPFELAPTYEGLLAGLLQSARLAIMLASLALLLATTNRENLMAGFFLLLQPLRWMKLNPERFTARLWLTLHYVDHAPKPQAKQPILQRLSALHVDEETLNGPEQIHLTLPDITWRDVLAMAGVIAASIYLL